MRKRIVLRIVAIALFHITALAQVVQGPNMRSTNGYAISPTNYNATMVTGMTLKPGVFTVKDNLAVDRIQVTQSGGGVGGTEFWDALGRTRIIFDQNGASFGDLLLNDAAGNTKTIIGIGGVLIGTANGNVVFAPAGSSKDFYALGSLIFDNATFLSSSNVVGIGYQGFQNAILSGSRTIAGIGYNPFSNSFLTNSEHIYALGDSPFDGAIISVSSEVYGLAKGAFGSAIITNGADSLYGLGDGAGAGGIFNGNTEVYLNGENAGQFEHTNSHVYLIGSGDPPTIDNQMVVGNFYHALFQNEVRAFSFLAVDTLPASFGDRSVLFGIVGDGTISTGNGSIAGGVQNSGGSIIAAEGMGSVAIGYADDTGVTIHTENGVNGAIAFGYGSSSGAEIRATDDGSGAFGYASSGAIAAESDGAFAFGKAGDGTILSDGDGAFSVGLADGANSLINANSGGAFAFGRVDSDSTIEATGDGSMAGGYADGGTITAGASGSLAHGLSSSGGTLEAQDDGATAFGAADTGTISAAAQGAFAVGYVSGMGVELTASGRGSVAMGVGPLTASGAASFALGQNSFATNEHAAVINLDVATATGTLGDSSFVLRATNGIYLLGSPITGDGAGLTNLTGATFPAGPTYVFHGKVTFNSNVVFNSQLIANGQDITNVYEKNVSVTTNGFGVSLIDFSLGTQVDTNMSGNLTLTGISNFNTTNLNWQVISLNPNGADRVIVVPNEWLVSGFTNATTVTLPTTNWGILRVECVIGRRTNASLEIYYP